MPPRADPCSIGAGALGARTFARWSSAGVVIVGAARANSQDGRDITLPTACPRSRAWQATHAVAPSLVLGAPPGGGSQSGPFLATGFRALSGVSSQLPCAGFMPHGESVLDFSPIWGKLKVTRSYSPLHGATQGYMELAKRGRLRAVIGSI